MNKVLASTLVIVMSFGLGVAVLIYGWGLEPRSWTWIIGGGVGARFFLGVVEHMQKAATDE
jgi:hypothetical protein